jgi:hypothetical protein
LEVRGRKWREGGEDCIMTSFITGTLHKILLGEQIKEDWMGEYVACTGEKRNS